MIWLYKNNKDNSEPYVLGKGFGKGLVCFGINPSTAEPGNLDPTLKSVERISDRHNYDSWVMLNVYSQRATNPNDLDSFLVEEKHEANLKHIQEVFESGHTDILAVWGTLVEKRPYLKKCLSDIYELSLRFNARWYCIGNISKAGHPHHPLYLKNSEKMKVLDIESYIENYL